MSLQLFPEEPLASFRVSCGQPFYSFIGEISQEEFQLLYCIATNCKENTGTDIISLPLTEGSKDPRLKTVASLAVRLIQLEKGSQVSWLPFLYKTVIAENELQLYLSAEIREYLQSLKLSRLPLDRLPRISSKLSMQILLMLLSVDTEVSYSVDGFRKQLRLGEHYQRWTDFTNKVLKPLQDQLKGTALEFTFFTLRKGNSPITLLFRIKAGMKT